MKNKLTITIPENWNEIPLNKFLILQNDLKAYEDDEEAQIHLMLYHLCGITTEIINGLSTQSYNELKNTLLSFMGNTDFNLQRIIQIDGEEYGFEPNLSNMSYGAYADITKFNELKIDKNWPKIMSILYRKVKSRNGETYTIEPYEGIIDDTKFLALPMSIHFGALFFFVNLSKKLVSFTLNSLMEKEEVPHNIKPILARSGEVMQQLLS